MISSKLMMILRHITFSRFYISTCLWTIIGMMFGFLALILPTVVLMNIVRVWAKGMMRLSKLFLGIDYQVLGQKNLPLQGPFIVACKHQSTWETISLLVILKNPVFVLKHSLTKVPIIGLFIKKLNMIPVHRGGENSHFLESARKAALTQKRPIVIFPQGTRVMPGQHHRYFRGVFNLYQSLHVPVIPAALNSGIFWPRRRFLKQKGMITIEFLQPILPETKTQDAFMEKLSQTIETRSHALSAPYIMS